MYRVSLLKNIKANASDKSLIDLTFNIQKASEEDQVFTQPQEEEHSVTKDKSEIKNFLQQLVQILNKPKYMMLLKDQPDIQETKNLIEHYLYLKIKKFFLHFKLGGGDQQKQDIEVYRTMIENSIQILYKLNDSEIYTQDQVANFFEINFSQACSISTSRHQDKLFSNRVLYIKKLGAEPFLYKPKWFILTNQYLCYVEKPFIQNLSKSFVSTKEKETQIHESKKNSSITVNNNLEEFKFKEVMLIDSHWQILTKKKISKTVLQVLTNNRLLKLRYHTDAFKSWKQKFQRAIILSPWNQSLERFVQNSFAPIRKDNKVKILIDGTLLQEFSRRDLKCSFRDLYYRLVVMQPVCASKSDESEKCRLDVLLYEAAERGVNIYILHWRGSKFAVPFDSLETKKYLQSLHPNIKLARHPRQTFSLWSHHAKLVIIDQVIVFIGGFDICFGRFDDQNHNLLDITNDNEKEQMFPGKDYVNERASGVSNPEEHDKDNMDRNSEIRMPWHDVGVCVEGQVAFDFVHHFVQLWNNSKLDKIGTKTKSYIPTITTRQKITRKFTGIFKKKKENDFNEKYEFQEGSRIKLKKIDEEETYQFQNELEEVIWKNINLDNLKNRYDSQQKRPSIASRNFENFFSKFKTTKMPVIKSKQPQKNKEKNIEQGEVVLRYVSSGIPDGVYVIKKEKSIDDQQVPFEKKSSDLLQKDTFFKSRTLKLPQKDLYEQENTKPDKKVFQKFDHIKQKEEYDQNFEDTKQANILNQNVNQYRKAEDLQIIMHQTYQFKENLRSPKNEKKNIMIDRPKGAKDNDSDCHIYSKCDIQALRSSCGWSLGLLRVEHSIYEAYIQLIQSSERMIFIQNQFFLTCCTKTQEFKKNTIKNKIGLAIRDRILRAHKKGEEFLFMLFIPLMPGFPGDVTDSISSVLRIQISYVQKTIAKGEYSLIEMLKKDGVEDPFKYIKVFGLRNHAILKSTNQPVEEIVYIHAKLMIVDDKHIILGSANINDRSMLGSRDHETCILISQNNEEDQIDVELGSKTNKVSKLAHKFRTELMMEHWDLPYEEISNPIKNIGKLMEQVITNSKTFHEIFLTEPSNKVKNFKQLTELREERYQLKKDKEKYLQRYLDLKDKIRGHIVLYPTEYLREEELGENFLNSELLVPEIAFT